MDKREGKGLFVSNDGEHYDGEWARDEKNGFGEMDFINGH